MNFQVSSAALAAIAAIATPTFAQAAQDRAPQTAWEASRARDDDGVIRTGVARARDRLDSATSTSSLDDSDIAKISPVSLSDLFRTIPGVRSEASTGESLGNFTIRGLPMVSTGAKYLQFQEDGLPVLEFGDLLVGSPDNFLRADFNVAQVESIRGGSASTFASNAPGGVINLVSKTGEIEGGSIQASTGLDHGLYRTDFDYGGHLSETLRFHIGGFYREGEGVRDNGYTGNHGGQIKFNITKDFDGGFFRVEGKLLDDTVAHYGPMPLLVSGTNDDPTYRDVPNFSVTSDALTSRNISTFPILDSNNNLDELNVHDGNHSVVKAIGFQTRFKISDWTISEHVRYAIQSGSGAIMYPFSAVPAAFASAAFGSPGGRLTYASGPQTGQVITSPSTLNGNGLVLYTGIVDAEMRSFNNLTNDLRASRVWEIGGGDLTTTVGIYNSAQDVEFSRGMTDVLHDVRGDGNSALINIINANGTPRSQNGALDFSGPRAGLSMDNDVRYRVLAPYGSLNFHRGPISIGASVRLDDGQVEGSVRANRSTDVRTIDSNNDGVISDAERTFAFIPNANATPVNYDYRYTSYSGSINYRVSEVFSTFARYSRGARAGADRILLTPAISNLDGSLLNETAAYDPVKQAEVGVKYRREALFANLTGYWAASNETNTQIRPGANGLPALQLVTRGYRAYGAEFEGGIRRGPFSLTAGATVTDAEIVEADDAALVGHTPRHQAKVIYQLMPQYEIDLLTVGASVVGTTSSYSQDENLLKMPGFATVNAFLQVRPMDRVVVSLNANNLFDEMAITDVSAPSIPTGGVVFAQTLYGRTVTAGVRFFF